MVLNKLIKLSLGDWQRIYRSWGSKEVKCDSSLFVHTQESVATYVLVYIDDIIQTLISDLNVEFALKDLGSLRYFLRIVLH